MMRSFFYGIETHWNVVKSIIRNIWWKRAPVPKVPFPKGPFRIPATVPKPKPVYHSKYFGIFRNTVPKTFATSTVHSRQLFVSHFNKGYAHEPVTGPKVQLFISRVFQFGLIGFAYTQNGEGFISARTLALANFSFIKILKKELEKENREDAESDIVILEDDVEENLEEDKEDSGALFDKEDVGKFAELNVVMHDKLEQLESLIEMFEVERTQDREEVAMTQKREEDLKRKVKCLEKENMELKKKMDDILLQAKELAERHTRSLMENAKMFSDLLAGNADNTLEGDAVACTFEEDEKDGWVLLH